MQSKDICLLASRIAKGGAGMVGMAGQFLNTVLEDLKLNRNLKVNRVTQLVTVQAGSNGPFNLETDYLRTYDMSYPLTTPGGETQFLTMITMEQYDAEPKTSQAADFPYEFATDLSTQAQAAAGSTGVSNGVLGLTAVQYGNYGTIPTISFTGGTPTAQATANALMGVRTFSVSVAGSGYAIGDVVFGTSGLGLISVRPAQWVVNAIGGGGAISGLTLIDPGEYSALSSLIITTTNGAGSSAILNTTTWFLTGAAVTFPGTYLTAPTAVLSGGTATTQGSLSVQFGSTGPSGTGQFYVYPMGATPITITHRYMRNQPDIVTPETSAVVPWFPFTLYLIRQTAAHLMCVTGDDRESAYLKENEEMLRPFLIMEGDEQQTVRAVRLDPRRFRTNGSLRPTKIDPY